MISIERIDHAFRTLERPSANRWHFDTVVPSRLHLSISHEGAATVFIEGDARSFGQLPLLRGLEHRHDAQDVQSGRVFGALRLTAPPTPQGSRATTYIAYELSRRIEDEPAIDNASLVASVAWILQLLGAEPALLSAERQRGLVAELLLLRRLLQLGRHNGIGPQSVLDRWWGPTGGKRDFAAVGTAIEVKSTALNMRSHHISTIDQLEPLSDDEQAYLYSMGMKSEPTFDRKLPTYVQDVVEEMTHSTGHSDTAAIHGLKTKLASAGYDPQLDSLYTSGPGLLPNLSLPPLLFHVDSLDRIRLSSFRTGKLPSMVTAVSYQLEVSGEPLGASEAEAALMALLQSPPMYQSDSRSTL